MALADDIAALKSAIRRGALRVRYDGHEVEYRSLVEMNQILAGMERAAGTRTAAGSVAYPEFTRGDEP